MLSAIQRRSVASVPRTAERCTFRSQMIAAVSRSNFDFEFSCILLLTRTSIVAQYVLWCVLFRVLNNNYQFNNLRMSPGGYQKGPLELAPEKHSSVALSDYSASAARHFPDVETGKHTPGAS